MPRDLECHDCPSNDLKEETLEMIPKPTSKQKNEYNPHEHRQQKHPTTNAESIILILKGVLGTGILAMPQAFSYAGLLLGTAFTILLGALVTYCVQQLIQIAGLVRRTGGHETNPHEKNLFQNLDGYLEVKSQYELCKMLRVPVLSYPETMKAALEHGPPILRPFTSISGPLTDFFLLMYQLGMCSVYFVFVARTLKEVIDPYYAIDLRLLLALSVPPVACLCCVRSLKLLAPLAQVANVLMYASLAALLCFVLRDLPPVAAAPPPPGTPAAAVRFFTTTLFALSATGVIVSVERNMEKPSSFGKPIGVLNIAMTVVVIFYTCIGFFGFVKYGENIKPSISLNLPTNEIIGQVVKLTFALSILLTFALQFHVAIEIICTTYLKNKLKECSKPLTIEYSLRVVLTITTFLAALVIPMLDLFISLIGALCLSSIGILFPAIVEICVLYSKNELYIIDVIKNAIICIIGLSGLVIGTYLSIDDIINRSLGQT